MRKVRINKAILLLVTIVIVACSSDEIISINKNVDFKNELRDMNLDAEFNIPNDIYNEFISNAIFNEKGELIGAIYDKIEENFGVDNSKSNSFWSNFDVELRSSVDTSDLRTSKSDNFREPGELARIYEGYKPKRGHCKANNRWICIVRH